MVVKLRLNLSGGLFLLTHLIEISEGEISESNKDPYGHCQGPLGTNELEETIGLVNGEYAIL